MSIHPEGKSCSDLCRVLVLKNPPAWRLMVRSTSFVAGAHFINPGGSSSFGQGLTLVPI